MRKPIDWMKVERLALAAFTGKYISVEEQKLLEDAHRREPDEYKVRTEKVRAEERARLQSACRGAS